MSQAKLKPGGLILIVGFAAGVLALGWYTMGKNKGTDPATTGTTDGGTTGSATGGGTGTAPPPDGSLGGTTETAFTEVGREGVGTAVKKGSYNWNKDDPTVVFPINIWAGWGPIIAANDGFAPGAPNSVFKKYGFKVELKLIDDPSQTAAAYASGQAHTMWGTLDMIALFAPQLKKVGLTPQVFQQVDWSQGGDGVVVRSSIRNVKDLSGKTIVLCQNSPSHYYILRLLADQGLSDKDVRFRFTQTAFGASALFAQDRTVHACVSWAPDIYNLTDPDKNPGGRVRLLSTTADAANVIADVWAARPDFARDHPDVIEGLVKGIFEGVDILKKNPSKVAQLMAQGYGFPADECEGMLGDAYSTGLGDNAQFFLTDVATNKVNFEGTWNSANEVYRKYGAIKQGVAASEVMNSSVIKKLQGAGEFRHQKAQEREFAAISVDLGSVEAGEDDVLRVPKRIRFKPNKWDLDAKYDEKIPGVVAEIAELCQRYSGARIIIEGNVDTSRKNEIRRLGQRQYAVMSTAVTELSEKRAKSVRAALLKLMPKEDPNRFVAFGNGWDNPIDLLDHTKNRRVDVRVIRLE